MTAETGLGTSGAIYQALVKDLVAAEDARRTSLESRAMTVVTVSGTLVTLLLALSSAIGGKDQPAIPGTARGFVVAASAVFFVAAVLAISTYAPRSFAPYDIPALCAELAAGWQEPADAGLRKDVTERLEQLRLLQTGNNSRGTLLILALAAQVLAIAQVAIAVAIALAT